MVTAAGDDHPDRLVADLSDEFSRRGIKVSQLPIGPQNVTTASSTPAPARKVLTKWSHHRQEKARQELDESLDQQSAIIVTDPRRLDEVADLQVANRPERPVVVLLATDPDNAPDELPELVDVVVTPNPKTDPWMHLGIPVHSIGVPAAGGNPAPGDRPKRVAHSARAPMGSLLTPSSPSTAPARLCPAGPWKSALTTSPESTRR